MKHLARAIASVIAVLAIAGMSNGIGNAATPEEIAATCARAIIPTDLCNGTGGSAPANDGVGRVKLVDRGSYYSGNKPDVILGYDKNKPVLDDDGNPTFDEDGNPIYTPIMGAGEPIFTPYPRMEAGQIDGDGNLVVSY